MCYAPVVSTFFGPLGFYFLPAEEAFLLPDLVELFSAEAHVEETVGGSVGVF